MRQGYSAYLPRYRTWVSHARRRQAVLRPLFPRCLFAGVNRAAMPWCPILSTVRYRRGPGGQGTDLGPAGILAATREREELGAFDRLDPRQSLSLGNQVRVTADAFEDMVGRLVELRDHDRVVVLLELLGARCALNCPPRR